MEGCLLFARKLDAGEGQRDDEDHENDSAACSRGFGAWRCVGALRACRGRLGRADAKETGGTNEALLAVEGDSLHLVARWAAH